MLIETDDCGETPINFEPIEKELLKLEMVEFKEIGLVNNIKGFDPDEKDEIKIKQALLIGEVLNKISD